MYSSRAHCSRSRGCHRPIYYTMADIEESVSGFKTKGGWVDVVEHGERITQSLKDIASGETVDEDALSEFDEWRPKSHERLDEDVNEKTAAQASVSEGQGEKAGKEPNEDLQTAGEKLSESYQKVDEGDEALERWSESIGYVARAADSAGRKALRKVEDTVYRNVMTQIAPYYFDNDLTARTSVASATRNAPSTSSRSTSTTTT